MRRELLARFEADPGHRDAIIFRKEFGEIGVLREVFHVAEPMLDTIHDNCPHRRHIIAPDQFDLTVFSWKFQQVGPPPRVKIAQADGGHPQTWLKNRL